MAGSRARGTRASSASARARGPRQLVALDPNLERSVSYTTRRPRPNEKDGVDYSFVSREEFERLVERGELLEHATYDGNMYGTSAGRVEDLQSAGHDVILKIEVKGA